MFSPIMRFHQPDDAGHFDPVGLPHAVSSSLVPDFPVPPGTSAAGPRETSRAGSISPPSVFDDAADDDDGHYTEVTSGIGGGGMSPDETSYDLKPPPPSVSHGNAELLADRLFSIDHLDCLLRDSISASRFRTFLGHFQPQHAATLAKYLEAKKALASIDYANAVAQSIATASCRSPYFAAKIDDRFAAHSKSLSDDLVDDALPAYITHRLVQVVTESMVKEITGNSAPLLRDLIPSLAEVFCVSDPSLPDNPIVYASQEFYNVSQYGREYAIGRNCRFLQGPKTSLKTVSRLIEALSAGHEITETVLNYRRDGSPFVNLLMLAPLYDNKGQVRYFLGAQIDVTSLIQGGRGLDSFAQLLAQDRTDRRYARESAKDLKDSRQLLGQLGQALSHEEATIVQNRSRSHTNDDRSSTGGSHLVTKEPRRRIGMDDPTDATLWPDRALGPSGRLPGVYQNYLLIRPYPSLRITFTSPALRIPGLLQTKFLDRIGGSASVRDEILESFAHGTGITAKITWLTAASPNNLDDQRRESLEGRQRWIHCTPLLGSDEKVGVWMVVMVDYESITGTLHRGVGNLNLEQRVTGSHAAVSPKFSGNRLYAEYLRGGRGADGEASGNANGSAGTGSVRGRDEMFRDF